MGKFCLRFHLKFYESKVRKIYVVILTIDIPEIRQIHCIELKNLLVLWVTISVSQ